jgi:hypothetical protein
LNNYSKLKVEDKQKYDVMQKIVNEIKTTETIVDSYEQTRTKNFEFWFDTMKKKIEYESKFGKVQMEINMNMNNNTNNNSSMITSTDLKNNNYIKNNINNSITSNSFSNTAPDNSDYKEIAERIKKQQNTIFDELNK